MRLVGCKGRELASYDGLVHMPDWYVSKEDVIEIEEDIKVVDFKADYQAIAQRWGKHVFHLFNWNDADEDMIEDWQRKFIERRL